MPKGHAIHDVPEFYDYLKHLTTLATGSLVLLIGLLDKFPKPAQARLALAVALIAFLASFISFIACMLVTLSSKRREDGAWKDEGDFIMASFFAAIILMVVGVISLTVFAL